MRNYIRDLYWAWRSGAFEGLSLLHCVLYEYSNLRFALADRFLRSCYRSRSLWRYYKSEAGGFQPPGASTLEANHEVTSHEVTSHAVTSHTEKPKRLVPFGQTPLLTMRRIVRQLGITSEHTILDLGCGSGRLALWLASQVGCRVVAIDQIESFINHARLAAQAAGIRADEVTFIQGDFIQAPFEKADIVYLYGMGMDDQVYERLCLRLLQMPTPPWIITIGGPLCEYSRDFTVMQQFPVVFPWGWTKAYLNICGKPKKS